MATSTRGLGQGNGSERKSDEQLSMTLISVKSSPYFTQRRPQDFSVTSEVLRRIKDLIPDLQLKMNIPRVRSSGTVVEEPSEDRPLVGEEIFSGKFGVTRDLWKHDITSVYTFDKNLGQGGFGTVFLSEHKVTGKLYACKTVLKGSPEEMEDMEREVRVMHHLTANDNIVQLREVYEDELSIDLVMELCAGGNLLKRFKEESKGYYSEKKAASLCRQIVEGVQTCHSAGVMHRDLKMENILFVTEEEDSPIKLIDFGLSEFFKHNEVFEEFAGSVKYMAPEIYTGSYGKEIDLWSAGVILHVLLCGRYPFESSKEKTLEDAVTKGDIKLDVSPWDIISNEAKDLVKKMLERDPKKRLTATEVLSHPWILEGGPVSTTV